jgi:glycerol-3-phosphate acyltransferase PlsY
MLIPSLLLIAGAYLLGSVSATYLVGRWLGGKDLRQYGSGSLGGSMVFEHVSRWAVVPVALFDVFKATVPALLALWLDLGVEQGWPLLSVTTGPSFCGSTAGGGWARLQGCGWRSFRQGRSGWARCWALDGS